MSTAIYGVRRNTALTVIVYSAINYARTFCKEYETLFLEERICNIVDDMESSNLIYNAIRAIYFRYALVGKPIVRNPHLLQLLKELRKGHPVHILLGVTHVYDATLHGVEEDSLVYIVKIADAFVKSKDNKISLHSPTFYKYDTHFSGSCEFCTTPP